MQNVNKIHKTNVEKTRKNYMHTLSSHAFSSIYLWQYAMKLSLSCEEDFFNLRCEMYGENAWFFPCGNEQKIYDFVKGHMQNTEFSLYYLREEDVKWLEEKFPNKWEFHRTEESDEYIGDIAEYLSLKGSKFSEIRRKIRKIDREYEITSTVLTDENIMDAMTVISRWREVKHTIHEKMDSVLTNDVKQNIFASSVESEKNSVDFQDENVAESALKEREFLEVSGIIVYANHVPVCVFAGFPLSEDTIDIVIGKTAPDAPKGIS